MINLGIICNSLELYMVQSSLSLSLWVLTISSVSDKSPGQRWFVWRICVPLWALGVPFSPDNRTVRRQIRAPILNTNISYSHTHRSDRARADDRLVSWWQFHVQPWMTMTMVNLSTHTHTWVRGIPTPSNFEYIYSIFYRYRYLTVSL